jgi:phage terminase large subunit GpA-like protein
VSLLPADRVDMNRTGIWLADGLVIDELDRISGNARSSEIASYWLGGVAAAYQRWFALIERHLRGLYEFSMTGSELPLQTTANTDQGVPYLSQHLRDAASAAARSRTVEADLPRYVVPEWARFLVAVVDVQGGRNARFVVQVHAVGEHQRQAVIDRYTITDSMREGMGDQFAPLDPASHPEDWDVLNEKVLKATYRTTVEGVELCVHAVGVDTGGEGRKGAPENVTNNAYAWARRLRKLGLHSRLKLLKGVGVKPQASTWHIRETKVGGKQGHGDLTLYLLNSNLLKDAVQAGLQRRVVGPNYYHLPAPRSDHNPNGWVSQAFYDELTAEVRNEEGVWEQVKRRNETFDLCQMVRGVCLILGAERREFWNSPPAWALPLDSGNSGLITAEARREMKAPQQNVTKRFERRVSRSSYLG